MCGSSLQLLGSVSGAYYLSYGTTDWEQYLAELNPTTRCVGELKYDIGGGYKLPVLMLLNHPKCPEGMLRGLAKIIEAWEQVYGSSDGAKEGDNGD